MNNFKKCNFSVQILIYFSVYLCVRTIARDPLYTQIENTDKLDF